MWIWPLCPSLALPGAEDHTSSVLCSATVGTTSLGAVSKHLKSLFKVNARPRTLQKVEPLSSYSTSVLLCSLSLPL